jgi:hypothetical protein
MSPLILLILTLLALSPTTPSIVKAEPAPELDLKFHRTDGWIGADGAFSVPVSEKRALWLFSDTWVGSIRNGKRTNVAMVNNTVGVQEGTGRDAKLTFSIARTDDGKPKALFTPADGRGWYWLFAGAQTGDKLHVFLPRFEKTSDHGAFGFRSIDLWLGTVDNPGEVPTSWKIHYSKVPCADFTAERKRLFGSALLRVDDFIYIYGYDEKPGRPFPSRKLLVARVPAEKLADFTSWQFLADGMWKVNATEGVGLFDNLATEFSVSYLPGFKQYVLVYTEKGLSDRIIGRFSTSPGGPWSEPVLFYTCPEMKQNKKVFTYAAKAHPHVAVGNELVLSYVVNAFELGPVIENAELYWPRFVRVGLK